MLLVQIGGDVHIYKNQVEGIKEQLTREPRKLPTLKINPDVTDILAFKWEDFTLEGYDPHPAINFPIAI
jgi:thymidylate synthase